MRGLVQIDPLRIVTLGQFNFPGAPPFFDLFLSPPGCLARLVRFEPDEAAHAVFGRKAWNELHLVLPYPADQIVGHSDVQCSVRLACQQIGEEHHRSCLVGPGFRRDCG